MARETITAETCLTCGACCVSTEDQPALCDVTAEDVVRLGPKFVRLHVYQSDMAGEGAIRTRWATQRQGPFKGAQICACVALRGNLLQNTSCSVYEDRPRACREAVKPGDRICRETRAHFRSIAHDLREGLELT